MKRLNQILHDQEYRSLIERIETLETDRLFCKHDVAHFLDVARIAYILNLQEKLGYDMEIIYTAAVLHDIGRAHHGEHAPVSADMALPLLQKYGYSPEETALIINSIRSHGKSGSHPFDDLIFRADKRSRLCFRCHEQQECYWPPGQKNENLLV